MTRLLLVFVIFSTACAAAPASRNAPSSEHAAGAGAPSEGDKQLVIRQRDEEIVVDRKTLGLTPRPEPALVAEMHDHPVIPVEAAGVRPADACGQVCTLSDAICKAQGDICRLADELSGDDWARGRCDSAKASCFEARKRCTDCQPSPHARVR
jgi:hypothetical protein